MSAPDAAAERPPATRKTSWSKDEDAVLRDQVRLHGAQNWEGISAALPGRNAKSCRLRWCQHLAPGVDAGRPFTAEEDAVVVACHRVFPNKWSTIARFLQGRTDNDVKNRCNTALRHLLNPQQPGTLPLFPLAQGDVRASARHGSPVVLRRRQPPDEAAGEDHGSGACLDLFPLVPGDLVNVGRNNAFEAAAMDADVVGAAGDLLEMRLWPASTAMAVFRAMVQAVRAP